MSKTVSSDKKPGQGNAFGVTSGFDPDWLRVLEVYNDYSRAYGFTPVSVPLLEEAGLYRTVYGPKDPNFLGLVTSDIQSKPWAIRSSLLPGVLKILAQSKVGETDLLKWVYEGAVVKINGKDTVGDYEFGFEVFGHYNHLTEAQVLSAAWQMMSLLGLSDVVFEVSTCGSVSSQRKYADSLLSFLAQKKYQLCDNCADNMDGDVMEVLRCQVLDCQTVLSDAPTILDFLDDASKTHFTNLLEALEELQIPYQLNPLLLPMVGSVGTVALLKLPQESGAEILASAEGHEQIVAKLGTKNLRSFGLHGSLAGAYRALKNRSASNQAMPERPRDVYLVPLGELASKRSLRLFRDLVEAGVSVFDHFGFAGVKNQLKAAQDAKSPIALIMGQKEALDETVILRDVKSGMQEVFSYDKIVNEVKKRLGQ